MTACPEIRTHPLAGMLALAVPLEIQRLWTVDDEVRATQIAFHTRRCEALGHHADELLYGGKYCQAAFAELARALACLAFQPGGVNLCGLHFCADHEICLQADAAAEAALAGEAP